MADQQRRVSLIFEANASQAKNEINSLVQSLQKIQSMPRSLIDPTGIKEAGKAAMELQGHIQKAVNVDTGKLDLSRFATSLASSGKSLDHYRDTLTRIGPEGSTAFRSVLSSINSAEVSTVRLTKGMRDFLTTMKNTAKWQISSSIMHGFIGGLQSAWSYAQSLDRSLNNIRIVTGQTSDEMARFAVEANKAAQSLSTTTTKYTDAALIFYQQGLGDKAVKERTETVIKMANVTGEAAKDVSSYMTAIWNNFADGTKSLDYYADVITKLGAATAASSEEIAGGLEKFAAIGSTIGLSYEYATSMITTIVDKTRQSEDVVGTALKTILARVQGLNLGETLEDGTTLNKYSQALADVGVNIKDASGQLKDMDVILDDLGSKWSTFDRATQTALAQVVGGVRQYNQIISLMNNWDSFKGNVDLARSSTGSLDEQAEIYAESWEAARNRVTAAAQGIYDALINEDVFIKLDDIFTHLLQGVGGVVKGMGGMVPILSTIGGLITTKFAKEMPVALKNMSQNFAVLSGKANREALGLQQKTTAEAELGISRAETSAEAAEYDAIRRVSLMREELIKNQHRMNSEEKAQYELQIQSEQAIGQINIEKAKAVDLAIKETQILKEKLALEKTAAAKKDFDEGYETSPNQSKGKYEETWDKVAKKHTEQREKDKEIVEGYAKKVATKEATEQDRANYYASRRRIDQYVRDPSAYYDMIDAETERVYQQDTQNSISSFSETSAKLTELQSKIQDVNTLMQSDSINRYAGNMDGLKAKAESVKTAFENVDGKSEQLEAALKDLNNAMNTLGEESVDEETKMNQLRMALEKVSAAAGGMSTGLNADKQKFKADLEARGFSDKEIEKIEKSGILQGKQAAHDFDRKDPAKIQKKQVKASEVLTSSMGALMSVYGAVNAVTSAHAVLQNKDATAMEKTGAVVGALTSSMAALNSIMSLISLGPWGIIAAVAAAGIAALVIAISNYETEEEKRLRKLEEKAEGLKSSYDSLKTKVEETAQAFENYDQAVETLYDCAAGTEEWYQALINVNQMADAIIAKSPELAKFARWDETGKMYFAEGAQDYLQQQQDASNMIYAAQQVAQAEYDEAIADDGISTEKIKALDAYEKSEKINIKELIANYNPSQDFETLYNYVEKLKEIFGEGEELDKYLEASGLEGLMTYGFNGERILDEDVLSIGDLDEVFANARGAESFIETPEEYLLRETSVRNSMNMLLGGKEGFIAENATLYATAFQSKLEEQMATITERGDSLKKLYEATTGDIIGEDGKSVETGKVISEAVMLQTVAAQQLTQQSGVLTSIIAQGNAALENSTAYGQSILRSGLLGARSEIGHTIKRAKPITGTIDTALEAQMQSNLAEAQTRSESYKGWEGPSFSELKGSVDTLGLKANAPITLDTTSQYSTIKFLEGELKANRQEQEAIQGAINQTTAENEAAQRLIDSLEASNDTLDADIEYYQGLIDSYGLNSEKLRDTADIEADIMEIDRKFAEQEKLLATPGATENETVNAAFEAVIKGKERQKELLEQEIDNAFLNDELIQWIFEGEGVEVTEDLVYARLSSIESALTSGYNSTLGEVEAGPDDKFSHYTWKDINERLFSDNYSSEYVDAKRAEIAALDEEIEILKSRNQEYNDSRELEVIDELQRLQEERAKLESELAGTKSIKYLQGLIDARTSEKSANQEAIEEAKKNIIDLRDLQTSLSEKEAEQRELQTQLEEATAEAEAESIKQNQAKAWIEIKQMLSQHGIYLGESITAFMGEDGTIDFQAALDYANTQVQTAIASAELQDKELMDEANTAAVELNRLYNDSVAAIFSSRGDSLGAFLKRNSEIASEGMSMEEVYKALTTEGTEFNKALTEEDARRSLIEQLTSGDTEAGLYDIDDEGWKKFLESGYGESTYGTGWRELYERGEITGVAMQDKLIEANEHAQALAVDAWNKELEHVYKSSLSGEGEYASITTTSETLKALRDTNSTVTEVEDMAAILGAASHRIDTETFKGLDGVIGDLINSSDDATPVITALNEVMGRIQTTGKDLTAEEVIKAFNEAGINLTSLGVDADSLTSAINGTIATVDRAIGAFESFSGTIAGIIDILSDLQTGDEIDAEDWEQVKDIVEQTGYSDLFYTNAHGGKTYVGTAEQQKELEQASLNQAATDYVTSVKAVEDTVSGSYFKTSAYLTGDEATLQQTQQWMLGLGQTGLGAEALTQLVTDLGYNEMYASKETLLDSEGNWTTIGQEVANAVFQALSGNYTDPEQVSQILATSGADRETMAGFVDKGLVTEEDAAYSNQVYTQKEVENLGFDLEQFKLVKDALVEQNAELANNEELLDKAAIQQMRQSRALESAQDNIKDWTKNIKEGNKALEKGEGASQDYYDSIKEIGKVYADLFNVNYKDFSEGFLRSAENAELLEETLVGNVESYHKLQKAAADDIYFGSEGTGETVKIFEDENEEVLLKVGVDETTWDTALAGIQEDILAIDDINVTADMSLENINAKLSQLKFNSIEAAQSATASLSTIGVNANIVPHEVTVPASSTITITRGLEYVPGNPGRLQPVASAVETTTPAHTETYYTLEGTGFNGNVGMPSSGGGRRGGGGGGGGGGGSRKPQAEKKQSSDKERYHTVTNQLEDLTDAYDKVSKAADRAFGKSRVKLLREQQGALKDLAATQQDYLDEIDSYLKQDRSNLDQVSQYIGFDVQLDENGTITNFDAIQDAMWDEYNSHINDKGEVTDMDEEAWKEYEKEWDRIMALIEQYEETQDKRKEALQQLQDYINEIYDLQLEEVTYAVEVDIEASDDALEILDYLLSRIEDDAWKAAEAITYMGEQAAIMLDKNDTYTSGIRDILMNHTEDIRDSEGRLLQKAQLTEADVEGFMSGDPEAINKLMGMNDVFTDEEIQQLREYHSSLIKNNEELIELRENVFDKVINSFEQFNEELDKSIDKIDHLSAVTENYKNIIDIVGKKNLNVSNALLDSLNQASTEQRINRVEATRTKRDTIAAEIVTAEAALAEARKNGLEEDAKLWEKTLEEMRTSLDEAEEDFMQSWEDALDGIRQQFEEAVGHAVETLSDALAGPLMGSMEELQDAFDRQNTIAERYLPDYEKIYELNKLNRDITNSIDETDNIKAKQELAALQAEINALEESEAQISEYQMENLRRRYELKQAEIALTEAQDAKSQVQMSRDADGNWSYVYTANEDQVAEAEQTYEDRLFAMQEANAEYINAMNDSIIQLQAEMTQKIEEIMMDETLSAEEKMARVQEVTTFYQEQMNYYMDELELVLGENQVLYEEDWAKYSELTGYKMSANEDYVDNFNETALSTLTGFQTMEEYQQNFNEAIGHPDSHGLLYDLSQAYETWKNNTEAAMEAAGTSIHNFADDMAEDVDDIVDASEKATEEIEKMGEKVEQTFTDLTTAVQNWSNEYSATIDAILEKNTALAESFNKILQSYSDYKEATTEDTPEAPEEEPEENTDAGEPADEGANVADSVAEKTEKYKKGIAFAIWSHPSSGWGTGNSSRNLTSGTRYDRLKAKGLDPNTVQQQINAYRGKSTDYMKKDSGISFSKWSDRVGALNPYTYKKFAFDTGGYTGDWGEEGRWALLHSKEIVLNKDDTANLLSAVDMIRQISKAIDLNAYSSAGYGNSIIKAGSGMGGTLEQNVHITAEFPNATNREEIYSAFTDIINLASQYANRK